VKITTGIQQTNRLYGYSSIKKCIFHAVALYESDSMKKSTFVAVGSEEEVMEV
jgi:hypothetical protein